MSGPGPLEPAEVARFAALARRFCALCDGAAPAGEAARWRALAAVLAELCAQALLLPEVEPSERPDPGRGAGPRALPDFGARGWYREVYDPYGPDEEPVIGSLSDDLGDVYLDLREGLDLLERGTEDDHRDAVWAWRFSFQSHWGEHATGALRALYWVLREAGG